MYPSKLKEQAHQPKFTKWIRKNFTSCRICFGSPVELHHLQVGRNDWGKKIGGALIKDDRYQVPLCGTCHRNLHNMGEQSFWPMYKVPHNGYDYARLLWKIYQQQKI